MYCFQIIVSTVSGILGDSGADSGDEEKSKRAEKYMAQRKVKNGEKSPWGQCLTRPVPNGRSLINIISSLPFFLYKLLPGGVMVPLPHFHLLCELGRILYLLACEQALWGGFGGGARKESTPLPEHLRELAHTEAIYPCVDTVYLKSLNQ